MGVFRKEGSPFWWLSFTHEGKRVFASTGATDYKVAKQVYITRRNDCIRRKATGELPPIRQRELIERFLDYSRANKRSYPSDCVLGRTINSYFGEVLASEVTPHAVERFKAHRRESVVRDHQVSGARINRELAFLKTVYNKGSEWSLVSENPVRKIKFFSEKDRARTRYLTPEEKERLLAVCHPELRRIVIFALKTGMRAGEIFNLKWTDIDPNANTIELRRTKSGRIRYVPIHPQVGQILESLPKTGDFVFAGERGGSSWHGAKRAQWDKAVEAAGLRDFRFHDLRHSFASELVMKGVDLKTVAELLGHSTIRMAERYSHLSPSHKAAAIQLLPSESPAPLATPQVLKDLGNRIPA